MILFDLFTSEGRNFLAREGQDFSQRIGKDFCARIGQDFARWASFDSGQKKTASRETVGLLLAEGVHLCFPKQYVFYFLMTLRVWTLPSAWMSRMM